MDIKKLLKNKFIITIPIALVLLGCLYKFNEFKKLSEKSDKEKDESEEKENKHNIVYYLKAFVICYAIGLCLLILLKKGYSYFKNQRNKEVPNNMNAVSINEISKQPVNNIENTQSIQMDPLQSDILPLQSQQPQNTQQIQSPPENTMTNMIQPETNKDNNLSLLENLNVNEAKQLNLDVDTSNLEEIPLENIKLEKPPSPSVEDKKKQLLAKRKKLLELKKRKAAKAQKGGNNLALEVFNTGTPNF